MHISDLLLFIGLGAVCLNCSSGPNPLDYCQMIEADQSFVNNDRSNMERFEADRAKRKALIEANFNALLEVIDREGFPTLTYKDKAENTCRYRALTMTMIHAAQLFPERFFGPSCVTFFATEMKAGRLEQDLLEQACIIALQTMNLCQELEPFMQQALIRWELDPALMSGASFVPC